MGSNVISNALHRALPSTDADITIFRPVGGDLRRAVAIVLGTDGKAASWRSVRQFLNSDAMRSPAGATAIHAVRRSGQIVFSVVPLPAPGRTSLLLIPPSLPKVDEPDRVHLHDAVAHAFNGAIAQQQAAGVHLTQLLLPPDAGEIESIATGQCGFFRLAELIYFAKHARRPRLNAIPEGYALVKYSSETHGFFADTIQRTYEDSLDCPALAGRRPIEDVIAGHKAAGVWHPSLWHLAVDTATGQGAGVLLLSGMGHGGTGGVELVYLGLTKSYRGKGLANHLLSHAEAVAEGTVGKILALAVDSTNGPALRLYERHGLKTSQVRVALMRDLTVA